MAYVGFFGSTALQTPMSVLELRGRWQEGGTTTQQLTLGLQWIEGRWVIEGAWCTTSTMRTIPRFYWASAFTLERRRQGSKPKCNFRCFFACTAFHLLNSMDHSSQSKAAREMRYEMWVVLDIRQVST